MKLLTIAELMARAENEDQEDRATWARDHPEAAADLRAWREHGTASPAVACAQRLLRRAKHRSKQRGGTFAIGLRHVLAPLAENRCEATGLPFDFDGGPFAPSLDQVRPAIGYIPGNVQVVLWAFNRAKNDLPGDVFDRICTARVHQLGASHASHGIACDVCDDLRHRESHRSHRRGL